jgi:hypothetical protein
MSSRFPVDPESWQKLANSLSNLAKRSVQSGKFDVQSGKKSVQSGKKSVQSGKFGVQSGKSWQKVVSLPIYANPQSIVTFTRSHSISNHRSSSYTCTHMY